MEQQLLDDLKQHDDKYRLRSPLLEKIELWAMFAVGGSLLFDFYSIIIWGFYLLAFQAIGASLLILAYLVSWKKASIAFDSNPQQHLFSLSEALKVLQFICGLILLWKCYGCVYSLWYFINDLITGTSIFSMINWLIMLVLDLSLTGLGIYYLILNDKATKYVNRI